MSASRVGIFVKEGEARPRRRVKVILNPNLVLVGGSFVNKLDLPEETTASNGSLFVKELFALSRQVDAKLTKADKSAREDGLDDEAVEAALLEALRLDEPTCAERLDGMRSAGATLRALFGQKNKEMLAAFRAEGFLVPPATGEPAPEEPALTFVVSNAAREAGFPILWDMFYEGKQTDDLDWRRFWGFRVPITYWSFGSRPEEIRLKHLFSATHEGLKFAGREVERSLRQAKIPLPLSTLRQAMDQQVELGLLSRMEGDRNRVRAWREECPAGHWLNRFLDWWQADALLRDKDALKWKARALQSIFGDPRARYDLIHFACHCKPGLKSQFLSRLDMEVAGEPVSLEASFVLTDLSLRDESEGWTVNDPGPIVFLNACGTAQPGETHEPPGLPNTWIDAQGAVVVVVTLCPVPDFFAYAFAEKFYALLFGAVAHPPDDTLGAPLEDSPEVAGTARERARHRYIAEAFLATRRYFMEEYNNPLGLAYLLYAVEGANVHSDFLLTGENP